MTTTKLRAAGLPELVAALQDEQSRKLDLVAGSTQIRSEGGIIRVAGSEPVLTPDGVDDADGLYRPTEPFVEGVAYKLGVPTGYLKRMHRERPDVFDANMNLLLRGSKPKRRMVTDGWATEQEHGSDPRKFMLRLFTAGEDMGVARAFVSDKYSVIDHLDIVMSVLEAIRGTAHDVEVHSADLTDRAMNVKVSAPGVALLAPELLKGYRSPFSGQTGDDNPTVFAGFAIRNSEVGGGAFVLVPEITVEICNNGMTLTKQAMREVHLGGKQDEGVIKWSRDTNQKQLEVIKARTRDAVTAFLDEDFMRAQIQELEAKAGKPIDDAQATVERVTKQLMFSQEQQAGVLAHFIKGGQLTAGGVMQAVTSYSQTIEDGDAALAVQDQGVRAMELV